MYNYNGFPVALVLIHRDQKKFWYVSASPKNILAKSTLDLGRRCSGIAIRTVAYYVLEGGDTWDEKHISKTYLGERSGKRTRITPSPRTNSMFILRFAT